MDKLRVDKWLWAARFFKTRARAKEAIDGGKVKIDGDRVKPSREIQPGDELVIRQGWDEKIVVVRALSNRRGGAPDAALLYQETEASVEARELAAAQRKSASVMHEPRAGRPTKRDRRQIHRFRDINEVDG
jgi:ribosome-associated heat shock protein Hsp15